MSGVISLWPGSVARLAEQYWRLGWRGFQICSGAGPVPPLADDPSVVGGIGMVDGRRIWRAES